MLHPFEDIRSRIPEPPQWWDENGVPRYCKFKPGAQADIYADELAYLLIRCQACRTPFKVAMSRNLFGAERWDGAGNKLFPLAESIRDKVIHYGDPPNVGCCAAGATMNCDDVRVLGYWRKQRLNWKRDKKLEIEIEGDGC